MNTPLVSVIVPVYKAEAYLHKCVDSLLAQTMTDFEVLLIDDGSPDRSGAICDEYAAKDSRIRVFHKENGGVASARQVGIENVRGEYTIHADPDDLVEPTMLEELYAKAKEDDADMVICDYYINIKSRQKYHSQEIPIFNSENCLYAMFDGLIVNSLWNKLVKTKCFKDKICFEEGINIAEDQLFNFRLFISLLKVVYLKRAFYHYEMGLNENSYMTTYKLEEQKQYKLDLANIYRRELKGSKFYKRMNDLLLFDEIWTDFLIGWVSSVEFKSRYRDLYYVVKIKSTSYFYKFLLFFSCLGFYKPMKFIYDNYLRSYLFLRKLYLFVRR